MDTNERIAELLIETKAYTDLEQPAILASGQLGIFYINTEKLCQDGGKFKKFGDESQAMIRHANQMAEEHPTFGEVINILTERVDALFPTPGVKEAGVISGGQRRDWIFSGPIATKLGLPHVSLYKQIGEQDQIEMIHPNGFLERAPCLAGLYAVHVVDLITEGSSVYSNKTGVEKGWVPMLRNNQVTINNLLAVVTRRQGGEETLARQKVDTGAFVSIDEDFLKKYSTDPERALAYMANPTTWSENHLANNGALSLIDYFAPPLETDTKEAREKKESNLVKAGRFMDRYASVLSTNGKMAELEAAVQDKYEKPLDVILGGK